MPNRTHEFQVLVREKESSTPKRMQKGRSSQKKHQPDEFLQNAKRINNVICTLRDRFYKTRGHHGDFKIEIKLCQEKIKGLEAGKRKLHNEYIKVTESTFGFLYKAPPEDLLLHYDGIIWFLNKRLLDISQLQMEQQKEQLWREKERADNQLLTLTSSHDTSIQQQLIIDNTDDTSDDELPPELQQELEEENSAMFNELNHTLSELHKAEMSLMEISELGTQITNHLATQSIQTDQLYEDAIETTNQVEKGNLQLIKTRERNRGTRKFVLAFLIVASFVLLFLDWYS